MPYLVKFIGSYQPLLTSEQFQSLLEAHAFARENQHKVPGAAVMAIVETDENGEETNTQEIVKL